MFLQYVMDDAQSQAGPFPNWFRGEGRMREFVHVFRWNPRTVVRYLYYRIAVFAFCPDCGLHNSLQILSRNLELVGKMLAVATTVEADLGQALVENALEDCVSAFDGFGREICCIHADKSSDE